MFYYTLFKKIGTEVIDLLFAYLKTQGELLLNFDFGAFGQQCIASATYKLVKYN